MLVRLIDVVLILLFGFISISTVERRSPIQLPESESSAPMPVARGDVASVTVLHEPSASAQHYLVGFARGPEQAVAGRNALTAELVRMVDRSAELASREGHVPEDLRVDLRVDAEDRIGSTFEAYEVAEELGLVSRIIVRVPSGRPAEPTPGTGEDHVVEGVAR